MVALEKDLEALKNTLSRIVVALKKRLRRLMVALEKDLEALKKDLEEFDMRERSIHTTAVMISARILRRVLETRRNLL